MEKPEYSPISSSEVDDERPLYNFRRRPRTNLYTILISLVIAVSLFILGAFVGANVPRSKSQYISLKDPQSLIPDCEFAMEKKKL